jgi:hypothetical protein
MDADAVARDGTTMVSGESFTVIAKRAITRATNPANIAICFVFDIGSPPGAARPSWPAARSQESRSTRRNRITEV